MRQLSETPAIKSNEGSKMQYSGPTDGFRLAYERSGSKNNPVVLLHGWPGDHTDWDQLVPGLIDIADVLRPDLRGFGQSDKHEADPEEIYSGRGQARAVIALMDELGLEGAVVAGYDVGSFVSQTIAAMRPQLVKALVVSPPLPGAGQRVLELGPVTEFWYTSFHQLDLGSILLMATGTRCVRIFITSGLTGRDRIILLTRNG